MLVGWGVAECMGWTGPSPSPATMQQRPRSRRPSLGLGLAMYVEGWTRWSLTFFPLCNSRSTVNISSLIGQCPPESPSTILGKVCLLTQASK